MNETAKNALAKWREENKGVKAVVLDPMEKARQNPRSKVLAIRAYCWDCVGGSRTEVTLCPSTNCPFGCIALGRVRKMTRKKSIRNEFL